MESPSKMKSLFNGLKNLSGFAAILLSFWAALVTAFFVGPNLTTLYYLDGYKPATFTIEKLVYIQGVYHSTNRTYDKYWAEGTIDGKTEKFKLGEYVKGVVQNQEELDAQFEIGQKLAVYYNPEVPEKYELRVLYPDKDFFVAQKRQRDKFIKHGYFPLGLSWALCLLFGLLAGKINSAIKFCIGSLFMVGFVWVFNLLRWLF